MLQITPVAVQQSFNQAALLHMRYIARPAVCLQRECLFYKEAQGFCGWALCMLFGAQCTNSAMVVVTKLTSSHGTATSDKNSQHDPDTATGKAAEYNTRSQR